jgi:hypothetical protein
MCSDTRSHFQPFTYTTHLLNKPSLDQHEIPVLAVAVLLLKQTCQANLKLEDIAYAANSARLRVVQKQQLSRAAFDSNESCRGKRKFPSDN